MKKCGVRRMKFRSPETGEVFLSISSAADYFCRENDCFLEECPLKNQTDGRACVDWVNDYPHEAARLMGYKVVEETQLDKMFERARRNISDFDSRTVKRNEPSENPGELEEVNMEKPLKDWTLGELSDYCKKVVDLDGNCFNCEAKKYIGLCPFEETAPCDWDFEVKPRFTEQEVERAKAIRLIYPTAYELEEANPLIRVWDKEGKLLSHVDTALFLSIQPGQFYTLDEIIKSVNP